MKVARNLSGFPHIIIIRSLLLAFLSSCVILAQSEVTIRSTTRLVQVRVAANNRDGKLVQDLRRGEFEIRDNGKPRPLAFFAADRTTTPLDPESPGTAADSPATGEYTVILLDWLNAGISDRFRADDALRSALKTFRPRQKIALYVLGLEPPNSPHPLRLIRNFAADSAELANVIEDPGMLPNPDIVPAPGKFDARYGGNLGNPGVEEQLFDWNNRIRDTLRALSELANSMAPLHGRKTLIWMTTGFPVTINGSVVPGARNAEVPYLDLVERALAQFNRSDIAVNTINSAGLGATTSGSYGETLRNFAERTGGIAFSDRNDLDEGVRAALDDIDKGYTLGFLVPEGAAPGMHSIEVRTSRLHINLRFRRTYEVAR
jgi:VWFA-related protein